LFFPVPGVLPRLVAPEQLITAFTNLADNYPVVPGQFGNVIDRHTDRVGEGLVDAYDRLYGTRPHP